MTEATFERKNLFGGLLAVSEGESLITVVGRMAAGQTRLWGQSLRVYILMHRQEAESQLHWPGMGF